MNCRKLYFAGAILRVALFAIFLLSLSTTGNAVPPFAGTIFMDPDIITESDPTAYQGLSYVGQDLRVMFDRRVNDWTVVEAYLFDATFDDGLSAEIQVNPEFGSVEAAQAEAEKYAPAIGQLPTVLRWEVETVWIHQGTQPFGGGNNSILIHTGQADLYIADGFLEETLVHEAAHTSLDFDHASSSGWLAAQAADGEFISTYAADNPTREDIAESFLTYLAIRHLSDRISPSDAQTIQQTIPHRITYFDDQFFNMYPFVTPSADYNQDGTVDAADYVVWRKNLVAGDYNAWREQFGDAVAGTASSTNVPEPASVLITFCAVMVVIQFARTRAIQRVGG